MKKKSLLALLLALVMVFTMASTVMAAAESYSITVMNTNAAISISGNTYNAYKIFDVTYSQDKAHFAYTVAKEFEGFSYTVGDKSYSGDALVSYVSDLTNDSEALDAFAKAALKYVADNNIAAAGTATVGADSKTATINVPSAGYYLVTGTVTAPKDQTITAACALTTTKPTAEIDVKADAPSIDKKIVEGENKVKANTAGIGDTVSYEITSKVPNMKGYTKYFFVMEDTLSKGLTFNDDVAVKIGDKTLTKDTDYTLTTTNNSDGTTSIEIVFKNFIQYKKQVGAAITVTYSATVNQDAELDPTVGNPNDVKLIYSNNPNVEGKGTPENPDKPKPGDATGETPKSIVKTYVTGLKLTKVDGDGKTLTGAKFRIEGTGMKVVLINKTIYKESANGTYYMLKDGSYTTEAPVTDKAVDGYNEDKYDSITTKYEKVDVVTKDTDSTKINVVGYVDANGVLTFEGLGEGTYTITELVAPNGYNLLKAPITITITANATLDGCTWTVKNGETGLTAGADHLFAFNVVNNAGTELPSTGGIGTTVFYVLGSVLVLGAIVLLVTKRRMKRS